MALIILQSPTASSSEKAAVGVQITISDTEAVPRMTVQFCTETGQDRIADTPLLFPTP